MEIEMKSKFLFSTALFLIVFNTSFAVSAQDALPQTAPPQTVPPEQAPVPPEQSMPVPAPVEQPAPPVEPMAAVPANPQPPESYPPCSATLMDRCTNKSSAADVQSAHPMKNKMRRHHRQHRHH
jgi:hypothetical protein